MHHMPLLLGRPHAVMPCPCPRRCLAGVCQLTAKLRVMPKCWLLLLRLWIRVDGSMVRLRETRLFCRCAALDGPQCTLGVPCVMCLCAYFRLVWWEVLSHSL